MAESKHKTRLYISAVLWLSFLTLSSVTTIFAIRPEGDNSSIIATVLGITSPASLAFLGLAVKEVYLSTNSRLTELVQLTAKSSFAEGQLDESHKKHGE